MSIASNSRESRLNVLQAFFVGVASAVGVSGGTADPRVEKRRIGAMALATIFTFYVMAIGVLLRDRYGVSIFGWADLWPWRSDNFRSFKSIGFAFGLLVWLPLCIFWWRFGRTCETKISPNQPTAITSSFFAAWFFINCFGAFYLSLVLRHAALAVILQTAGLVAVAVWFWHRGRARSAP